MASIFTQRFINYLCGMKTILFLLLFCCVSPLLFAQQLRERDTSLVDRNYREDQFYLSVTYNLLGNKPKRLKQTGFSNGVHFGVIRDMPINEQRNKALGVGLGLSINSYNHNMMISKAAGGGYDYDIIDERQVKITRNKFSAYTIELPIQYRWRTSTASEYKFWRIYTGLKFGYVFYNASKFKGSSDDVHLHNNTDFNKLQYGLTLSAGYSTWNFNVYYGLNPLFKDSAELDQKALDMSTIKIGLMFYVF